MKRFRIALLCAAITAGVVCAYSATAFDPPCYAAEQYYRFDNEYYPVDGEFGTFYTCTGSIGYCTWYRPNPSSSPNWYLPCREGNFNFVY